MISSSTSSSSSPSALSPERDKTQLLYDEIDNGHVRSNAKKSTVAPSVEWLLDPRVAKVMDNTCDRSFPIMIRRGKNSRKSKRGNKAKNKPSVEIISKRLKEIWIEKMIMKRCARKEKENRERDEAAEARASAEIVAMPPLPVVEVTASLKSNKSSVVTPVAASAAVPHKRKKRGIFSLAMGRFNKNALRQRRRVAKQAEEKTAWLSEDLEDSLGELASGVDDAYELIGYFPNKDVTDDTVEGANIAADEEDETYYDMYLKNDAPDGKSPRHLRERFDCPPSETTDSVITQIVSTGGPSIKCEEKWAFKLRKGIVRVGGRDYDFDSCECGLVL